MEITKLQLCCTDLQATKAFYRDIPGLELIRQDEAGLHFKAGNTELVFSSTELEHPVYHFAFTIPSNKFEEALNFIKARTALMELPDGGEIADFSNWNAHAFYFYDNCGNIVEYIARFDLDNSSDVPFSGSSICCISEIGLVSENVPALTIALRNAYGIPVFDKQPAQSSFTVLGDNEGLLILVAEERHWYPTSVPAQHAPVLLSFRNKNGTEIQLPYDPEHSF